MTWLLMNWKLVAVVAIFAALGVQTLRLEALEAEYDHFKLEVAAAGREAKAKADAINAHQELVNEELEQEILEEREARARERATGSDRFASLYNQYFRLLNDPRGGGVPEASPSPAQPLPPVAECGAERRRIAQSLRHPLEELYSGIRGDVTGPAADALDARDFWGKWARLTGACDAPRSP